MLEGISLILGKLRVSSSVAQAHFVSLSAACWTVCSDGAGLLMPCAGNLPSAWAGITKACGCGLALAGPPRRRGVCRRYHSQWVYTNHHLQDSMLTTSKVTLEDQAACCLCGSKLQVPLVNVHDARSPVFATHACCSQWQVHGVRCSLLCMVP